MKQSNRYGTATTENTEIFGCDLAMPPLVPRILVTEDNEPILRLISTIINREGYTCERAINIGEARSLLSRNKFDILFRERKGTLDKTFPRPQVVEEVYLIIEISESWA